jgi:hypothetical protein
MGEEGIGIALGRGATGVLVLNDEHALLSAGHLPLARP